LLLDEPLWCSTSIESQTPLASKPARVFTGNADGMSESKANNAAPKNNHRALIYVVDDEPMLLELASVILEPLGFGVKTFRDPDTAIENFSAAKPPPALIITDYSMHSTNGLDLIKACRSVHPRQRILLVSGTVDEYIYRDSPFKPDSFLAKPYQAKELVDAVESLLES
jgi:DNA-binding NtrC family response regulator